MKKEIDTLDKQLYKVTKSNELIQKSKIGMTLQEQKIIAFLISKINIDETDPYKYYIFDTKEFCEVCEIDIKNYINVRRTLKKLYDRESIEILLDNGCIAPLKWLGDYELETDASKVSIQLHFRIVPFLIELKKNFTTYYLHNVLDLKNKFSISLYELFMSYSFKGKFEITVQELKSYLGIQDGYERLKLFKQNVINKCVLEINDSTNLRVEYKDIRTGRKITGFKFFVKNIEKK